MTRISLEKFIENTKGKKINVPWQKENGSLKGQCVSLIQQYISQCLGQPAKARGNAINWKSSYVKEGLGKVTTTPRKGDIVVFNKGLLGHIAIYIDSNTIYDQNNGSHDNRCAGYGEMLTNKKTYLRPNIDLVEDKSTKPTTSTTTKYVYNCESLNVRSSASTNAKAINDLACNTKVVVYETKSGWSRIGTNQWVASNYLTTKKPSKVYSTKEVTTSLNVRTSNSFSGSKNITKEKCPLDKGTLVSVIETSGSGIRIGKNRWVYKSYLK